MLDFNQKEILIGIDPGRDKVGLALVTPLGKLIVKKIIKVEKIKSYLARLAHKYTIKKIILGNGTNFKEFKALIKELNLSNLLVVVDETGSTERAEKLYFRENPPRGIKKLLSLFVSWSPSQAVDDYAAYILVMDYLDKNI